VDEDYDRAYLVARHWADAQGLRFTEGLFYAQWYTDGGRFLYPDNLAAAYEHWTRLDRPRLVDDNEA
jgi:hypothetical protein